MGPSNPLTNIYPQANELNQLLLINRTNVPHSEQLKFAVGVTRDFLNHFQETFLGYSISFPHSQEEIKNYLHDFYHDGIYIFSNTSNFIINLMYQWSVDGIKIAESLKRLLNSEHWNFMWNVWDYLERKNVSQITGQDVKELIKNTSNFALEIIVEIHTLQNEYSEIL